MSQEALKEARELLNSRSFGVLSTLSVKLEGFPFGSVVPYCLDEAGAPVILISTIAEHTKNLMNDPRCSITILRESNNVQSNGRLCLVGNMEKLPTEDEVTPEKYYRHFPKSAGYHQAHDFSFYRLDIKDIRYIGGFGRIHWLDAKDFCLQNPFNGKSEAYIINHMNEDHQKDLALYSSHFQQIKTEDKQVRMVGIDTEGFDVFVDDRKLRFTFENPVTDAKQAREAFVALSKAAKA
ncbi:MAG: DUF2470 domain-containing protein [Cytophagales bacterium]|nr:DUF2470 domain-containing protein [Cytophagales bacterium]